MIHKQIKEKIKEALKARAEIRLSVFRGLLAAFINELVATKRKPDEELSDEDRLVADFRLSLTVASLGTVVVSARQTPRSNENQPTPGSTERALSGEQLMRLPIDASDPNSIAALSAGVVGLAGTDSTSAGWM